MQGHSWLYIEFRASLGYRRDRFKKLKERGVGLGRLEWSQLLATLWLCLLLETGVGADD